MMEKIGNYLLFVFIVVVGGNDKYLLYQNPIDKLFAWD